jgi:hypothetical protein
MTFSWRRRPSAGASVTGSNSPAATWRLRIVVGQSGAADEPAHNHVFLEAAQFVALAHDRRLGQHARGFLKRCRGMNESVDSDALVIPSSM